MAEEKSILTYKGKPLMRKDNVVYYGSMADSHIVMPVSYTHLTLPTIRLV